MDFALWPVVQRAELVRTFRPGEPPDREAPFRTLRGHEWATAGVPILARTGGRAAGRVVLYSTLNVEAAICARFGEDSAATAFAKAAGALEKSRAFRELHEALAEYPSISVSSVADGVLEGVAASVLGPMLRALAGETESVRLQRRFAKYARRFLVGRIRAVEKDYVVVVGVSESLWLPRQLARAAHREQVGECVGVINSQPDERELIVRAVPGIDLTASTEAYSPFRRPNGFIPISAADAAYLRGRPVPPKITIPITIRQ